MRESRPLSPEFKAATYLVVGIGLAVAGVYVLAGLGWALIAGSVPLVCCGLILFRGLSRGGE